METTANFRFAIHSTTLVRSLIPTFTPNSGIARASSASQPMVPLPIVKNCFVGKPDTTDVEPVQYCTPLCREKAMSGVAAGMLRSQHRFTAPSFIPVSREKQRGAAWLQSCLWPSEFGCCEERQPFSLKLRTPLPRSVCVQSRTLLTDFSLLICEASDCSVQCRFITM